MRVLSNASNVMASGSAVASRMPLDHTSALAPSPLVAVSVNWADGSYVWEAVTITRTTVPCASRPV